MLPFIKVFSLVVKVFTKPLITYTRKVHSSRKGAQSSFTRRFFLYLGDRYNKIETSINRRFLNLDVSDDFFVKPISDELAIDKGIEFFYEIIFYFIILSLPIYEMIKSHIEGAEKSKKLNLRLESIEEEIKNLNSKSKIQEESHKKEREDLESKIEEYELKIEKLKKEIEIAYTLQKYDISSFGKKDSTINDERKENVNKSNSTDNPQQ